MQNLIGNVIFVGFCSIISFSASYRHPQAPPDSQGLAPRPNFGDDPPGPAVVFPPIPALHWDTVEDVLFFSDVTGQTLYRYDPATKTQKSVKFDGPVTMALPVKGQKHHMIVGVGSEMYNCKWYWDTNDFSTDHFFSLDSQAPQSAWGIGRADNSGRIWAEALIFGNHYSDVSSRLYDLDSVVTCRVNAAFNDTTAAITGLAWSADNTILYVSSASRRVKAFDFDPSSGSLSNPTTILDFAAAGLPGAPAGLAMDDEGNLWIGSYGGSQLIKMNPTTGRILRQIKLAVNLVTAIVFGGPDLSDMYVTSSTADGGGSVIMITDLNSRGIPLYPANPLCKPCNDNSDTNAANWWCAGI